MNPQIYVANLAAYNAGRLHGKWIPLDGTDLAEAIEGVAKGGDWAVHDYDECPNLGEHPSLQELNALNLALSTHDPAAVFAALQIYTDVESALTLLDEGYAVYEDREDWAYEVVENHGLSDWAKAYFDYDALGRDLEIEHTTAEYGDHLYVFHG